MTLLSQDKLDFARDMLQKTKDVEGDIIEVGVFRGGALWHFCNDSIGWGKKVFGYDTFKGLPELGEFDNKEAHLKGQFSVQKVEVAKNIAEFVAKIEVELVEGYYPDSALDQRISFCHLDVDLYEPTKKSLEHLAKMLSPGGIIVCDDYRWPHTPGVEKAINECILLFDVVEANTYQLALRSK